MKQFFIAFLGLSLLASCSQGIQLTSYNAPKKEFVDVTMGEVNSFAIGVEEFSNVTIGRYEHEGTDSYIEIMKNGTCQIFTSAIMAEGDYHNQKFETSFNLSVDSASKNILYIRPATLHDLEYKIGEEYVSAIEDGGFLPFLPFYGFGGGRLEISPIMNGFIALPSGTYWLK